VAPPVKTLRQQQADETRQRIVAAATQVFAKNGFAGARIEDIAAEAGVAAPTVYKVFVNKRNLLAEAVLQAMSAGDTGGVADQDWWTEQLDEPDPALQLQLIARNARRIYERAGRVLEVVRAASPLDSEISQLWETIVADRLSRARRSAKALASKAGTSAALSVDDTALTLVALTAPELYTAVTSMGRSPAQYERWLSHVLASALLRATRAS
jgi:AcrR family transcriptional regulator